MPSQAPEAIVKAYALQPDSLTRVNTGLINLSFVGERECGQKRVLQRLNPIFSPKIHDDIEMVTARLAALGHETLRIVRSEAGRLYEAHDGEVWRALSFIEGHIYQRLPRPVLAESAGLLLGSFHRAMVGLVHDFVSCRPGAHDTQLHLQNLKTALGAHPEHKAHGAVKKLAARIFAGLEGHPPLLGLKSRVIHGDPKAANIIFRGDRACVLIDWDTLDRGSIDFELGDALRSWCNPEGEDVAEPHFSITHFEAAIRGYAAGIQDALSPAETAAILPATFTVAMQLAARFAADALNECYFGFNPERFESRSAHNLHRAKAQLCVAEQIAHASGELAEIMQRVFHRP